MLLPIIVVRGKKESRYDRYSSRPLTRTQVREEAYFQRNYNRNLRRVNRSANREVARTSIGLAGGFLLLLLAFSLFYSLSPNDNGQIMYTRTFLEMIRDAPVLDMSWANFRDDWLAGWDANFLPGLRNFVGGLIGILQVVAVLCGGIAQLCMYVFYFLGWLF